MSERDNTSGPALQAADEAVSQAMAAYVGRDWAGAERLCRAALAAHPAHAGALDMLGAIAAQSGRLDEAAALFARSVAAQPASPTAHNNLGNVLKNLGRPGEAVASYDRALALKPDFAEAHCNRGNALLALAQAEAAIAAYDHAIALRPQYAQAHLNRGNALQKLGQAAAAVASYDLALAVRADFAEAWCNRGVALKELGQADAAVASYDRALALNANDARAHYNRGNALRALQQADAAIACYERAIALAPDHADAHFNLAVTLQGRGRMEAAAAACRRAIALAPDNAEAHAHLGCVLTALRRVAEAEPCFRRALALDPQLDTARRGYAACIATMAFHDADPALHAVTARAMAEAWMRPAALARAACNLLRVTLEKQNALAAAPAAALAPLDADALLHAVLVTTPVVDAALEDMLTRMRRGLLDAAAAGEGAGDDAAPGLRLYCALAAQCFINEYVFAQDADESRAAAALRDQLAAALAADARVPALLVAAVGCYFPLHTLAGAETLRDRAWPAALRDLLALQVAEPLQERASRRTIAQLTPIDDAVSLAVQNQYEENPYPRWVRLPRGAAPESLETHLRSTLPYAALPPQPAPAQPEILIAGCGTGQQPIETAQTIAGANILAIDLSMASLAYAARKTRELQINAIEYGCADILRLDTLGRTFDVIESAGVLHHLADPFAGWRRLLALLRPGGYMRLGFYSAVARRHIVRAQALIRAAGYGSTPEEIRRCRQHLRQIAAAENLGSVLQSDFYSTSNCRDLLFHVQEHRLTLEAIDGFLQENQLVLLGFLLDAPVLEAYRRRFADDPRCTNLAHWAAFERDHPDTFIGMYQFWVCRSPAHRRAP
jgi:tetratricopeptide (TPR) repeat protein/2-polyprenyl-3-methyl-5-hydroxy-6-metoxy-1,4-benzoquinol methylase